VPISGGRRGLPVLASSSVPLRRGALGTATPDAIIHVADAFLAPPSVAGANKGIHAQLTARGLRSVSHQNYARVAEATDAAGVVDKTITNAANNGAGLIRITTSTAHGFATGERVYIYGVGGTVAANAAWAITVINATTFDLVGSAYAGAYTSGGTVTNRPYIGGLSVAIGPAVGRGGIGNADDAVGVAVSNSGTQVATDAFYVSQNGPAAGNQWYSGLTIDARAEKAFSVGAVAFGRGLDVSAGTYRDAPIVLPQNDGIAALKADGVTVQDLLKLNAADLLELLARVQGVPFPATQVPSADVNTLDDYEEVATFVPVLTFATPGNLNVVTSSATGIATKIGNMVAVDLILTTSTFTHTTAAGGLQITGLPFTCNATHAGRLACNMQGWTKAGFTSIGAVVNQGTGTIVFQASGSAQIITALAVGDMPSGGAVSIRVGGVYFT
jgi:hypothetical protein